MAKTPPDHATGSGKCPIHFALDVMGDKWSLLIVRDLVFKSKHTYGAFAKSPEGISTNILADRLAKLEAHGIVTKSRDPENQTKFVYRLTDKGCDLIPVLLAMTEWSARHDTYPNGTRNIIHGAPVDLIERAKRDRDTLVAELTAKAKREAPL